MHFNQKFLRVLKDSLIEKKSEIEKELINGNFPDFITYKYKLGVKDGIQKSVFIIDQTIEEIFKKEKHDSGSY